MIVAAPVAVADDAPPAPEELAPEKLPCIIVDWDDLSISIVEDCWEPQP